MEGERVAAARGGDAFKTSYSLFRTFKLEIGRIVAARIRSIAVRCGSRSHDLTRPVGSGSPRAPARDLRPPARGGRARRRQQQASAWRRDASRSAAQGDAPARSPWRWDVDPEPSSSGDARRLLPRDLRHACAADRRRRQPPIGPPRRLYGPRRPARGGHAGRRSFLGGASAPGGVLGRSAASAAHAPCVLARAPMRSPEGSVRLCWRSSDLEQVEELGGELRVAGDVQAGRGRCFRG